MHFNSQAFGKSQLISRREPVHVADYYKDANARALAHSFKCGANGAIEEIALLMAPHVKPGETLIPIPSRTGRATQTLELAKVIAYQAHASVADLIHGFSRESQYDRKKLGMPLLESDFGFHMPTRYQVHSPVLIDVVFDTGATMSAAWRIIPQAAALVFSRVLNDL